MKYGSKKISHSGYSFASKLEAALFDLLKLRQMAGEISDVKCQDHIHLTRARIQMIPDFKFFDIKTQTIMWAEAKGFQTSDWRIKRKLWTVYGPGPLEIWMGSHSKPYLDETIKPEETNE